MSILFTQGTCHFAAGIVEECCIAETIIHVMKDFVRRKKYTQLLGKSKNIDPKENISSHVAT